MKEYKNFLLVGILIAIMLVGIVNAQEEHINPHETTTDAPFSFKSWFQNTFGIQKF